MRKRLAWLASVSALTAAILIAPPALAKRNANEVQIGSFTGAYLAARVAEVDDDMDAAIDYYRRALDFDPDNQQLQQSLMLVLISSGRFEEALPLADRLKTVPEVERFSRVALAVDAIRKKDYREAGTWLKLALESDLDRLITGLMSAWTKLGRNDGAEAVADLELLDGPEWFELFSTYHSALIAEMAGLPEDAESAYQATLDNVAAGSAAPETWLRAAEAYSGFLARRGAKDEALAVLDKADQFATGRLSLVALREKINKGEKPVSFIANPADGASEVLLDLGGALNRGGGEPFVKLYLQLALALKPSSDAVLLQLAAVAEQENDSEEAISFYEKIPAASPLKRAADLQLGLNLADLKRHDEAVGHLKRLLDADPDDMRAYLALGGVYASKEDYKSAAANYDQRGRAPEGADQRQLERFLSARHRLRAAQAVAEGGTELPQGAGTLPGPAAGDELSRLFLGRHEHESRRGARPHPQGRRSAAERRLHRRFARLGLLSAQPVRRGGGGTGARGVAEAG